ncbi:MAG: HEPN domain-containing protein [Chloroflexi bacterium]|nr:HEPN domain-containing protein [Chloroflexota bacterium]
MTTHIADTTQAISARANAGPDTRALSFARALREATDVECVILFGSRARGDWTDRSDIDLMIIEPDTSDLIPRMGEIQQTATELASQAYQDHVGIDFVYLSRAEYERKSVHTLNHVARFARRDGIPVSRNTADFPGNEAADDPNHSDEPMERRLRVTDANTYYRAMHVMMDSGITDRVTAYNAQQTLEHAMKALISAQGHEYPHTHRLYSLAADINQNDPALNWQPGSDLGQLTNFAGGYRYGPLLTPISDYTDMANRVTDDLNIIYDEITRLTGENPWAVPPEGSDDPIQPRYR